MISASLIGLFPPLQGSTVIDLSHDQDSTDLDKCIRSILAAYSHEPPCLPASHVTTSSSSTSRRSSPVTTCSQAGGDGSDGSHWMAHVSSWGREELIEDNNTNTRMAAHRLQSGHIDSNDAAANAVLPHCPSAR